MGSCHVLVPQNAAAGTTITNDIFATDIDGNPIYAQGGGVFKFPDPATGNETHYWYGVKYRGAVTYQNDPWAGKNSDTGFLGFSCYSSTNLVDWKFENLSSSGLGGGWVGRMGVCYNSNTEKYVLLSQNYPGIMFATCDTPNGTFVYHHTQSGEDLDFIVHNGTGDQTIFIDDDGTPYLIASSVNGRSHLYVLPLRESDYLEVMPGTEIYSGSGHVPGRFHFHHYSGSPYTATTHQLVTGLPNGTYTLSVWHKSSGGQAAARIFARDYGGAERVAHINTAQPAWTQVTIPNILVIDRQCEVGLYSDAAGGQYVDLDDWSLTLVEAAPPPPPGELVAQWNFDETSGTTASESIAGQDGTLVGGASWSGGQRDNAVLLNGTSGHVSLPSGVVSTLEDFTIAGWFNLNSIDTWSRFFDIGTGTAVNMFLTPRAVGTDGTIRFAITAGGSSTEDEINGVAAPTTGAWHHVAVTVSGSLGILYVDGVEVGRNTHMTLTPSDLGNTTQNWIGRSQYTADPYLNGRVDDFRIYNYGLSPADVATLAAGVTAPDAPEGLNATPVASSQVHLNWEAEIDADSYAIKRAIFPGGPYTTVAEGVSETAYSDTGLSSGTTYYYAVSAVNIAGESPDAPEADAEPVLPQQPMISGVDWNDGHVVFSVSNATPGYLYHVLTTTNLMLPLRDWAHRAGQQFPDGGSMSITNPLVPTEKQLYQMIQLP